MTTLSHERLASPTPRSTLESVLAVTQMWASLAIAVIWIAVLFTAIYGPDIVDSVPGGNNSTVPSVVAVAFFASIATWAVAKYGFRRDDR